MIKSSLIDGKYLLNSKADLGKAGGEGGVAGWGARVSLTVSIFCYCLFFCNHFEELQIVLFEVELNIKNAPLINAYPNTIETCLTAVHLLFGR